MILLDTHIWIWWMNGSPQLPPAFEKRIQSELVGGIAVSVISFWEISLLIQRGRIQVSVDAATWIRTALTHPNMSAIELSPDIAMDSVNLPGAFHRDPADQIIVATARVMNCPLMTVDARIVGYPHVQCLS